MGISVSVIGLPVFQSASLPVRKNIKKLVFSRWSLVFSEEDKMRVIIVGWRIVIADRNSEGNKCKDKKGF